MNKKLIKWVVLLFLLVVQHTYSDELWHVIYSGPGGGPDGVNSLIIDNLNNIYVTGYSGQTRNTITTIKYNSNGVEQWMKLYSSSGGNEVAFEISNDDLYNLYITGQRVYGRIIQCFLLKYDSSGALKWDRLLDGALGESVKVDHHSNAIVVGWIVNTNNNYDVLVRKYDSTGNLLWTRSYDNPSHGFDFARKVSVDYLDNIIVAGYSENGPTYEYADYLTLKYSPDGTLLWTRTYDGTGNSLDELYTLFVDRIGNSYVTGTSRNPSMNGDCVTIKYAPDGTRKWVVSFNGPGNLFDGGFGVIADRNLNVYVTGASTMSPIQYDWDYLTIKYDSSGIQKWIRFWNGIENGSDEATSIALDSSDNVHVCGDSWENQNYIITALKYNPDGVLLSVEKFDPPSNSLETSIPALGIDLEGNIVAAGRVGSSTFTDMLTIKFGEIVSVSNNQNTAPSHYQLYQNYPNPFNPVTKIKFDVPSNVKREMASVKLVVFDILGREISVLVNEELKPGTYEVTWDASNYPSGIYAYKLVVSGTEPLSTAAYTETKKMILIK